MKFLDSTGLAHFWNKIKDWSNSNFLSKKGGEITPTSGLHYIINGEQLNVSKNGVENETIDIFTVDENGMSATNIVKTGGTATQVLMANGSVKTLNASNGIAGLDSKGNVPLSQLGNLDTTVAEVVTALPTTNIKKHIYLIKDTGGVTQNQYEEYIYTGDTSAKYDASKWEKLGDFRATVDLKDYAKKIDTIKSLTFENKGSSLFLSVTTGDDISSSDNVPTASSSTDGIMSATDKIKLNGIEAHANNYSLPLATASLRGGIQVGYAANGKNYPVQLSGDKAYVNVPWTDTNTTYSLATSTKDGLMSKADKVKIDGIDTTYAKKNEAMYSLGSILHNKEDVHISFDDINGDELAAFDIKPATGSTAGVMAPSDKVKLNGIASGATADSAITTAEIDALFV